MMYVLMKVKVMKNITSETEPYITDLSKTEKKKEKEKKLNMESLMKEDSVKVYTKEKEPSVSLMDPNIPETLTIMNITDKELLLIIMESISKETG